MACLPRLRDYYDDWREMAGRQGAIYLGSKAREAGTMGYYSVVVHLQTW